MCLLSAGLSARAQSPADTVRTPAIIQRINNSGVISVIQPAGLDGRLMVSGENAADNAASHATAASSRSGYRVQIFDSNASGARDEAQRRKAAVESRMGVNAYVRFDSPYWRVRVGDFRTRSEAEHALGELRRMFPSSAGSLRVVRDHIVSE